MSITIDVLKGSLYCDVQDTSFDNELQDVLDGVVNGMILELDNDSFTTASDFDGYADLERAIYKQATYEWKRRRDLGLSSTTFPDGTINKYNDDLFLNEVQEILNRYRSYTV